MVIFYEQNTNNVHHTENNTIIPTLPVVQSVGEQAVQDKRKILNEQELDFISVFQELGIEVLSMKVCFDTSGNFIGLQPKASQ